MSIFMCISKFLPAPKILKELREIKHTCWLFKTANYCWIVCFSKGKKPVFLVFWSHFRLHSPPSCPQLRAKWSCSRAIGCRCDNEQAQHALLQLELVPESLFARRVFWPNRMLPFSCRHSSEWCFVTGIKQFYAVFPLLAPEYIYESRTGLKVHKMWSVFRSDNS